MAKFNRSQHTAAAWAKAAEYAAANNIPLTRKLLSVGYAMLASGAVVVNKETAWEIAKLIKLVYAMGLITSKCLLSVAKITGGTVAKVIKLEKF